MLAEEGAPRIIPFGVKMVGPVIYTFGTDEQKERFLPGIRTSEVSWCQGYSEPGAGSDLASLRTRAVREGDHYIVNGQKTWTSFAHWGDWIFCLVRTNTEAKAQEGISFLLIDMKTPGITVKPIIMMDGGHEVNEVFFDNVKVPVANLVGKENEGWTCAKFLLANERLGIAEVPASKRGVPGVPHAASLPPVKKGGLPHPDLVVGTWTVTGLTGALADKGGAARVDDAHGHFVSIGPAFQHGLGGDRLCHIDGQHLRSRQLREGSRGGSSGENGKTSEFHIQAPWVRVSKQAQWKQYPMSEITSTGRPVWSTQNWHTRHPCHRQERHSRQSRQLTDRQP